MQKTIKYVVPAVAVGSAVLAGPTMAAVATEFTTEVTNISTDALAYIAATAVAGLGVLAVGLGWDIGFGLLKKFIKKGAK